MIAPIPAGLPVVVDPTVDDRGDLLLGGSPRRAMRLTEAGRVAYGEVRSGAPTSPQARALARRLIDGGLAHPRPAPSTALSVTVVIPVRDRLEKLARCLDSLGSSCPVVVVDDGSADAGAITDVVESRGATVIRREVSGGPGVARNRALADVTTDLVAFIDSDCIAHPGWVESLAGHLSDPLVAAAAPRIVPTATNTAARRYAAASGALDLGDREARVVPLGLVSYVPTAAIVVRRTALESVVRHGNIFDPALRYGEDVDLIWRLHDAGWRVRYDPSVQVAHDEPATFAALLTRRFHYGTSAAALSQRHREKTSPVIVQPLAVATVAAAVTGRPVVAAGLFAGGVVNVRRALRRTRVTNVNPVTTNARVVAATATGTGRYFTQFAAPVVVAALVARPRRRLALGALLLAPPVERWIRRRPDVDVVTFVAASLADDIAYGAGVWTGALRHRTTRPIRPTMHRLKEQANG